MMPTEKARHTLQTFCVLSLCLLMWACPRPHRVAVERVVMGQVALPNVTRLGIGPVNGLQAAQLRQELVAAFSHAFEVTDISDAASLLEGGQPAGVEEGAVDAMVTASIVEKVDKTDIVGEQRIDASGEPLWVYTRSPRATIEITLNILAVDAPADTPLATLKTSHPIIAPRQEAWVRGAPCQTEAVCAQLFPSRQASELQPSVWRTLASQMAESVAIKRVPASVVLMHDDEDPNLSAALVAASNGSWRQARTLFSEQVLTLEGQDDKAGQSKPFLVWPWSHKRARAWAHYNLGVALVYSGDVVTGIRELSLARELAHEPAFDEELSFAESLLVP